eukprot:SAG22_NODE_8010_length_691_cov_0.974662_1_plen_169_part_10
MPVNCKDAADRYLQDYPDVAVGVGNYVPSPFEHFQDNGKFEGRIWHSEICDETCSVVSAPFDWIDAQSDGGIMAMGDDFNGVDSNGQVTAGAQLDDAFFDVELPFPFPFFGQQKTHAKVSTNGYLTFSGEHSNYGNTNGIPNPAQPNDLIAPYWTDLDPTLESVGGVSV